MSYNDLSLIFFVSVIVVSIFLLCILFISLRKKPENTAIYFGKQHSIIQFQEFHYQGLTLLGELVDLDPQKAEELTHLLLDLRRLKDSLKSHPYLTSYFRLVDKIIKTLMQDDYKISEDTYMNLIYLYQLMGNLMTVLVQSPNV